MTDWMDLTRRAALASHRLIGWVYFDPAAMQRYAALGVPDGVGYYIATRGASLAPAGPGALTAAFGSIHPDFVRASWDLGNSHTTFEAAATARDEAVVSGLHAYAPEIIENLARLAEPMWEAADSLPASGRVLFASLRDRQRPADSLLSAWLGVNCIREWRGDTHWAIQAVEDLDGTMAGILDGAWRNYSDDWLPRSRGADDAAIAAALERLEERGLLTDGAVDGTGLEYRQELEDRLDRLCTKAWKHLGEPLTVTFIDLVETVGDRLVERIDVTAGPNWMPAARDRAPRT